MRVGFIGFRRRRFVLGLLRTGLSFDQRVIWYDNQLLADVEIGVGAYIAVNARALRIEDVSSLLRTPRRLQSRQLSHPHDQ